MSEKKRIAINGFGRIGRTLCRVLMERKDVELVAINDLADINTLAHLLKYDSIHGRFPGEIRVENGQLYINDSKLTVCNEKEIENLDWMKLNIDIVVEATGFFRTKALASKHLIAGAKKVIISAPPAEEGIKTVVLGVNEQIIDGTESLLSNASCTTNCAAPMVKIIDELCGVKQAYITTVHSYTGDQRLHDSPHKDLRRARAGAKSIVPTTTGAAKAIGKIFPHLEIGGCGIRVPVSNGSLTDITFIVDRETTIEEVNAAFKNAAENEMKGILSYITDPIVSVDIIGNPYSCVFDSLLSSVLGKMVKIVGWYDNEMGYSNRLADLINHI